MKIKILAALLMIGCSRPPTPAEVARANKVAQALCVAEKSAGLPESPAQDIARQFCATQKQLAAYLGDGGTP